MSRVQVAPALGPEPQAPPLTSVRSTIYLPHIDGSDGLPLAVYPAGMNALGWAFAQLWLYHPEQRRKHMRPLRALVDAARYRCETMMRENHFGHISLRGETANVVVRRFHPLSDDYGDGNQVESLGLGYANAVDLMAAVLAATTAHRDHVLGLDAGWASQNCIGVWCELNPDGNPYGETTYSSSWCLLSTPC